MTMTPDDDGIDFDALAAEIGEPNVTEVVNVQLLDDLELSDRYHQVTNDLMERQEALSQHTAEGRDLHSMRAALRIEMARRGLL